MSRARIPPDVGRVLETFERLGVAARRGLHLSEKWAEAEVRLAAERAARLARRLR